MTYFVQRQINNIYFLGYLQGSSCSKVFLLNNSDNATPANQSSSDEDSNGEPEDIKPVLIKNHNEFSDTSSTSLLLNIKKEIKTETVDYEDQQSTNDMVDIKPNITHIKQVNLISQAHMASYKWARKDE